MWEYTETAHTCIQWRRKWEEVIDTEYQWLYSKCCSYNMYFKFLTVYLDNNIHSSVADSGGGGKGGANAPLASSKLVANNISMTKESITAIANILLGSSQLAQAGSKKTGTVCTRSRFSSLLFSRSLNTYVYSYFSVMKFQIFLCIHSVNWSLLFTWPEVFVAEKFSGATSWTPLSKFLDPPP